MTDFPCICGKCLFKNNCATVLKSVYSANVLNLKFQFMDRQAVEVAADLRDFSAASLVGDYR